MVSEVYPSILANTLEREAVAVCTSFLPAGVKGVFNMRVVSYLPNDVNLTSLLVL